MDAPERRGNLAWALVAGALMVLLELVFFAGLVTRGWAERVRVTEAAWLAEGVGPDTARWVTRTAAESYDRLVVRPGLVRASYEFFLPSGPDRAHDRGFEALADHGLLPFVRDRLDVVWGAFHQALQRLLLLVAWGPFLALLLTGALAEGLVRRRIKQAGFGYTSPLRHRTAYGGTLAAGIATGIGLFLPLPVPPLAAPALGAVLSLCLVGLLADAPKRM